MSAVSTAVPSFLPGLALSLQKNVNSLNLSRSFHCSVVKVIIVVAIRNSFYILSCFFAFVNNFFYFLSFQVIFCLFTTSLDILPCPFVFVNTFFNYFQTLLCTKYQERRRRDLNPRAAINDLHPFQGCPFGQLGYFSMLQNSDTL